jgi:DNA uptake protein ComE-like DNA-binding protein
LLAVVVLVGSAIFVVTGMLFMAQAEIAVVGTSAKAAQARALGWSGVQVVMNELDRQRQVILDGGTPRIDTEYVLYETDQIRGVVRLLPMPPNGERLVAEGGKLDLNTVNAETIVATGFVDSAMAAAIIAYRDGASGPLQSVDDLLGVQGLTVEMLYGPLEQINVQGLDEDELLPKARRATSAPRGLADVLTTFSVEPMLQRNGRRRLTLDMAWSADVRDRLIEHFGEVIGTALSGAVMHGMPDGEGAIVQALQANDLPPEAWGSVLDAVTVGEGLYRFGRVDVNTATSAVIGALPGIEPEQAESIVRARGALSSDERAAVSWPVVSGILSPDELEAMAGRITTRCWTWRFRIAAVVSGDTSEGDHTIVYEAVVDLSDPQPRVAYLRDVTMLSTAAALARKTGQEDQTGQEQPSEQGEGSVSAGGGQRIGRWVFSSPPDQAASLP